MVTLLRPDTCRVCKFCNILENVPKGEPEGECKGAPPQVVALVLPGQNGPQVTVQTVFPRVNLDWTCGFWKPRLSVVH